jgi:Asp-tRNA(Asn)/Glu-tRNA(Gln) amidotransferase A subunit family amidase
MTNDIPCLTISEAARRMRVGALTPSNLLDQCLTRIDLYEPAVRAWVVIDRSGAREQARLLTDELKRGRVRGPLHGIPIGIKDIIDVAGLPTGHGEIASRESQVAKSDASCVKRLRDAGAIILGKTVTTAFAYLDPAMTRNPWDLTRTPGGSSSGSAAAVACGMCLGALGTQTVGSLTRPASYCGVCSLKPIYGAVARDGVLPLAPTLDHVGVMARCVTDLGLLASALIDDFSLAVTAAAPPQFATIAGHFADGIESSIILAMQRLLDSLGPVPVKTHAWPAIAADLPTKLRIILAKEAALVHGETFHADPDRYPPKIRGLIEQGLSISEADYRHALQHREKMQKVLTEALFADGSILVTPATQGPAPDVSTTGDGVFNAPWSYCGFPTISLPVDRSDAGLPLAGQLVGGANDSKSLFRAAAWLQDRVGFDIVLPPMQK